MKNIIAFRLSPLFFLILLIATRSLHAQYLDLHEGDADYAIPDPTALMILRHDAMQLLRPATVRELSGSFFTQGSSMSAPHGALAVEAAPFMLTGVPLSKYLSGRWERVLLRMRVSVGTGAEPWHAPRMSVGLRMMFHDDADLRADSSFAAGLIAISRQDSAIHTSCLALARPTDGSRPTPAEHAARRSTYDSCLTEMTAERAQYQLRIDSLRLAMKQALWNRTVAEGGAAMSFGRPDGSDKILASRYAIWLSGAVPIESSWQLAFGLSGMIDRPPDGFGDAKLNCTSGAAQLRLYFGGYSHKIFAGARYYLASPGAGVGIEAGGEVNLCNGVWIELAGGLAPPGALALAQTPFVAASLKYATPELR